MNHIQKDFRSVRSLATKGFLGLLMVFAVVNFFAILYIQFRPESSIQASPSGFIDACQELCARYGIIETGHVANDAKAFLAAARSGSEINDATTPNSPQILLESEDHPLVGKRAPQFVLPDDNGKQICLSELNQRGPVVVVFYYGYFCSHCVAQLFAINEDLGIFKDTQATFVAISADSSSHTAEQFKEYGRFEFPVISDEDRAVSVRYGCYRPRSKQADEDMLHGTFVIDRQGVVRWANTGYEPFINNQGLLNVLQQLDGKASNAASTGNPQVEHSVSLIK